jgi:hypothetical protein
LDFSTPFLEPVSDTNDKAVRLKIIDMDDIDEDITPAGKCPTTICHLVRYFFVIGAVQEGPIESNSPPAPPLSTTRKLIEEL